METDNASRYRSRILREMKANHDNPFNSPPSSTGSHGTVSPTLTSVFSDPEGESTRRLNEDIARVTALRSKIPVNLEAAHRKWPQYFSMPKSHHIFEDDTDTRPMGTEFKENKPPAISARYLDETTNHTWLGSNRTRAEMQPRVESDSDLSSILSKSPAPARYLSTRSHGKHRHNPSPLAKVHSRRSSNNNTPSPKRRRESISDAISRLRIVSSPKYNDQKEAGQERDSPKMSSAKSSLTAVPSPGFMDSQDHNDTNGRSFFMPDVSHLGDFVDGTLHFSGAMKNGVPVFVKHGRVHDRKEKPAYQGHALVDGLELPEDEENIFVSMDMIREEIVYLQEHYDKVSEYAENLQQQVERLEAQLKSHKAVENYQSSIANERMMDQKNRLEAEVATLQSRLEQASRKHSLNEIEGDAIVQEKDRAVRKLQEACEDISKLTRKLNTKERELETTQRQLESTEQMRHDNENLRRDIVSLKHGRDTLELDIANLKAENESLKKQQSAPSDEFESLRSDNNTLRRAQESLLSENRSLRSSNKALTEENEDLRENVDGVQHELDAVREELESTPNNYQNHGQDKSTLREDNESLVRHNEKYFAENKILRRENSGFERTIHALHDENLKLKDEVHILKEQLDHCRPIPKDDFSARLDNETEENMTSAFFLPDITVNTNEGDTETREMPPPPELTTQSNKVPAAPGMTEQDTRHTKRDSTVNSERIDAQKKIRAKTKASTKSPHSQKVAFAIPDKVSKRSSSNTANQGSKRRIASMSSQRSASKGAMLAELDPYEDSTGLQSLDNSTQDHSMLLNMTSKTRKQQKQDLTNHSQRSLHNRPQSRISQRQVTFPDFTGASLRLDNDTCPTLSEDARRVLNGLSDHSCNNCTVCSRITSHRGILTSADLAVGKKRVSVPRPVPVTERQLSVEDPTMRPLNAPGHALAMVIKGLEDESSHLQFELTRLQAKYNSSDKALGRRDRLALASSISTLLERMEAKNDQIYSLYDVLEGQKAAGQAMTEEEIEMTVLNITGMTVRDVTNGSEQLTWDGIQEVAA